MSSEGWRAAVATSARAKRNDPGWLTNPGRVQRRGGLPGGSVLGAAHAPEAVAEINGLAARGPEGPLRVLPAIAARRGKHLPRAAVAVTITAATTTAAVAT